MPSPFRKRPLAVVLLTVGVLAAAALILGGAALLALGFSLRPAPGELPPDPLPSQSAPSPSPSMDPQVLIEFEERDRELPVGLPRVEPPGPRSEVLVPAEPGLGWSVAVPEWMTALPHSANYMPFAAPDAWLTLERYTIVDSHGGARTIDSVLDGMGWGTYEDVEVRGDDTDFQIISRDTRDNRLRHERIINGSSDALVVRWWSDWDDDALRTLGQQVIDSARPTTSLDQPHPPGDDPPSADPVLDPLGYFSVPAPPDFTLAAFNRSEVLLSDPERIFWYIAVSHVATEERLTLEAAISNNQTDEVPRYRVQNSGGDADEFWWNGTTDSYAGYRHYLVGDAGYVQISVMYSLDDDEEQALVEENLKFVIDNITIAPLD